MFRPALALVVLAFALPGCNKKPEEGGATAGGQGGGDDRARVQKLCEGMSDLSLLYVAGLLELGIESLDPPGTRETIVAACKELALDVVECADRLALDDPKCNKALEKQLGLTDATERAGLLSGYIVALRGGTLVVSTKSRLVAVPVGSG